MMRTGEGTTAEEKDKILENRKQMKSNLTWNRESRMCAESQLFCAREPQKPWRTEESGFSEGRGENRTENGRTGLAKLTPPFACATGLLHHSQRRGSHFKSVVKGLISKGLRQNLGW